MGNTTGGGIGINVTANASQLNAQMAAAAAAAQAAGAAMQGAATGVAAMVAQMNSASAAMVGMIGAMNQATQAQTRHTGAARASTQALTNLFGVAGLGRGQMMELGHVMRSLTDSMVAGISPTRALSMEIPRIAQVVLELGPAAMAAAAGIAALSIAAIAGISALISYATQVNAIRDAQYAMGEATSTALAQTLQFTNETASKYWESRGAIRGVAEEIARIPGLTLDAQKPVIDLAAAMARVNNKDASETAKELVQVFSGGVPAMERFLAANNLLTPQITSQMNVFKQTNDNIGAINLTVAQFTQLLKGAAIQSETIKNNFLEALQIGGNQVADLNSGGIKDPREERQRLAPITMPDPDEQRRNANAEIYNKTKEEQLSIDKQLLDMNTSLKIAQADVEAAEAKGNAAAKQSASDRVQDLNREITAAQHLRDELVDPAVKEHLEQQLDAIKQSAQAALVGADNSGRYNQALVGLTIPANQLQMFLAAAAKYNVPPAIMAWVAQHESSYNPNARGPTVNVGHGPEQATGEAQILPSTAKSYGVDPTNQAQSIDFMAKYLRELFDKTGSYTQAVGKYGTFSPTQGSHSSGLQKDFQGSEQANNISDTGGQNNPYQIKLQEAQQSFEAIKQVYAQDTTEYRKAQEELVTATREASQNQTNLKVVALRGQQALDRDDITKKTQAQDEILAAMRKGGQEGTQAYAEAYEERQRLNQQATDQQFNITSDAQKREIQLERGSLTERAAAVQEYVARIQGYYGQNSDKYREAKQFEEQVDRQINQQKIQGNANVITQQISDLEKMSSAQSQALEHDVAMGTLSNAKKYQAEIQLVNNIYQAQMALLKDKEALYRQDSAQYEEIEQQKKEVTAQASREIVALQQKEQERIYDQYKTTAEGIASTMDGAIDNILNKSQSLSQVMTKVAQQILETFLRNSLKMAADWAAKQLFMQMSTVASQSAQTLAVTAGAATQTAVTTAARTEQSAVAAATNASTIGGDAAKAAAGTYQSVAQIPYVGWILAPIAAAAAFAAVMAFGSGISSAAGGWDRVPADGMMTELHKNEMVLPASIAEPMRGAIAGWSVPKTQGVGQGPVTGNVSNNSATSSLSVNYAPSMSGGSMSKRDAKAFFSSHQQALVSAIQTAHRSGGLSINPAGVRR